MLSVKELRLAAEAASTYPEGFGTQWHCHIDGPQDEHRIYKSVQRKNGKIKLKHL